MRRDPEAESAAEPDTAGLHWNRSMPAPLTAAQSNMRQKKHLHHWVVSWHSLCWRWHAPTPHAHASLPFVWPGLYEHIPSQVEFKYVVNS